MLELDEVVRQNQLACLPFAKSGRAEAELIERHPALLDIIQRAKRAKVDSLGLRSRLGDEDAFYAHAAKARPASRDEDEARPAQMMSSSVSNETDRNPRTRLRQQASNVDMMFEMEDDDHLLATKGAHSTTPLHGKGRLDPSHLAESSPLSLPSASFSSRSRPGNNPEQGPTLGALINAEIGGISPVPEYATSPNPGVNISGAWASSELGSSKLTMKEIMAQASSSSRTSSISSGLALKARDNQTTSNSSAVRLSQRERKRQQQQAQLKQGDEPLPYEKMETLPERPKVTSPWQVAGQGNRLSLRDVLSNEQNKSPELTPHKSSRQVSAPSLTLRQTVPGKVPAPQRSVSGGPQQQHPAPPTRSVSTPGAANRLSGSPLLGSTNPSLNIRSVRHAPPPEEPSLQLSMADILAQQQTEKEVIKEAVAKRSLQEIQEEQAFQEWWDQESRKVQEEEEAAKGRTVGPKGGTRGGRGRSRSSRGRGRGRHGDESRATDSAAEQSQASNPRSRLGEEAWGKALRTRGGVGRGRGKGATKDE